MRATNAVQKAARYRCADCGLYASHPIVKPVANPKDEQHGRCSNRGACELRQLRAANRAKTGKQ